MESTKKGIPYFVFGKTEKLRHIGNDSVERTDADIPMPGNGYAVSVAVNRQRHSHVAASGSRHTVAIVAGQELCDLIRPEGREAASYRDGLLPDLMQSYDSRHVLVIKVAPHRISGHGLQVVPVFSLGRRCCSQGLWRRTRLQPLQLLRR